MSYIMSESFRLKVNSVAAWCCMIIWLGSCTAENATNAAIGGQSIKSDAVQAPTASPEGGVYTSTQLVSLDSATPGAKIYYTLDGSTPTTASNLYHDSIEVRLSQTIKAIATAEALKDSLVASFTYSINAGTGPAEWITPIAVEAFPDTSKFPLVSWTPTVKFAVNRETKLGLFSDISGNAISTPSVAAVGTNTASANPVSTLGVVNTIYAKKSDDPSSNYSSVGSYKTILPPSFAGSFV